jgi:hypothetical protein
MRPAVPGTDRPSDLSPDASHVNIAQHPQKGAALNAIQLADMIVGR